MSYRVQAVTRLTLDLRLPDVQRSIALTQGDDNRRIEVTLIDGGQPFALPPKWTAYLAGVRPSGNEIYNGCMVENGRIIYDFIKEDALSSEMGFFEIGFDVYNESGDVVASPRVGVNVARSARSLTQIESNPQFTAIKTFVEQINVVNEELGSHATNIDRLLSLTTGAGTVTIPVSEWSDTTPHNAHISIPGNAMVDGGVLLVMPADNETKKECEKKNIMLDIDRSYDIPGGADFITFWRAENGAAPNIPLNFVYAGIKSNTDQKAVAALIGVDAYGAGGGTASGVDEEAVRNLIEDIVPSWARKDTAPVTSVNGQQGAVNLTIPSKASDVDADPEGTAKDLTDTLSTKIYKDLEGYVTNDQLEEAVNISRGIYVGDGPPPDDAIVWINPNGTPLTLYTGEVEQA